MAIDSCLCRLRSRLAPSALTALAAGGLALLLAAAPGAALAKPKLQSAIVVDFVTGEVLHAQDPDAQTYPASLTKMMTLFLVFDALDAGRLTPDTRLKVSARAAAMPPTKLGLKAGSSIRVEDAIQALVTRSANDIAATIAENLGGSESRFAELMTARARSLGMSRTTFRNASGLPDMEQRTTARDMATLSARLITEHPLYYRYFSRNRFVYAGRTIGNHNNLMKRYAGMDGIKTGYTNASGFNLASSAVRDGRRLVAVVLGGGSAPSRDAHMAKLMDRAFTQLARRKGAPAPGGLPEVREAVFRPATPTPAAALAAAAAVAPPAADPLLAAAAAASASALTPQPRAGAAPAAVPSLGLALAEAASVAEAVGDDPALAAVAAAKGEPPQAAASAATVAISAAKRAAATAASAAPPIRKPQAVAESAAASRRGKSAAPARRATAAASAATTAYGIQVGVFGTAAAARGAAQQALRRASSQLRGTFVSVHTVKQRKQVLFRAQLLGVARDDAEAACQRLKRQGQACAVVQTKALALASN